MMLLSIFIGLVFLYSLVSARLEQGILTPPIVFTTAGIFTGLFLLEFRLREIDLDVFLHLAEAGLVLLLFTDASRTELKVLAQVRNLPARLLSTGLLLTLVLGALCALAIFPRLSVWEAGVLSAILAPTDAGLGQAIVTSPRVPMNIRQALNVEAGLNDGLAVPFLLFSIALAGKTGGGGTDPSLPHFILAQLGYGTFVGIALGLLGGWLLGAAHRKGWMAVTWEQLGVVTLPLLCGVATKAVDASMFIAAFVAGLAVQVRFKEAGKHSLEFTEEWGQLLNLSVFFMFGLLVSQHFREFTFPVILYAVLSLTVVRILPVALALLGTHLPQATVLFMGWSGPRGLASIVLGVVFLEHQAKLPGEPTILLATMATVLISIFAHGLSAVPTINLHAHKTGAMQPRN